MGLRVPRCAVHPLGLAFGSSLGSIPLPGVFPWSVSSGAACGPAGCESSLRSAGGLAVRSSRLLFICCSHNKCRSLTGTLTSYFHPYLAAKRAIGCLRCCLCTISRRRRIPRLRRAALFPATTAPGHAPSLERSKHAASCRRPALSGA